MTTEAATAHHLSTHATAFGWGWGCSCGAATRGAGAMRSAGAAFSAGERHIARLRRKAAATQSPPDPAVDYAWADTSVLPPEAREQAGAALDRALDDRAYTLRGSVLEALDQAEAQPDDPTEQLGWYMAQAEADLKAVTEEAPAALDALADLQDTSVLDLIAWCQTQRRALTELERTVTLYAGQNLRVPRSGTMRDGRTFQVLKGKDRKAWDHDAWQRDARHAVIREAIPEGLEVVDTTTGEALETARHLAQRVTAAVQAVHGSSPPRTTALRRLGIDPDEYAETSAGAWTVTFTDPTTPTTED